MPLDASQVAAVLERLNTDSRVSGHASVDAAIGTVNLCQSAAELSDAQQPLAANLSTVSDAPGATSTYVSTALSFTSTIDSSLTTLSSGVVYDVGAAANAIANRKKLPVLIFIHGYNGLSGNISDTLRLRAASKGFVVLNPNMRGRGADPGSADDSARELQDLLDSVTAAAAAYPTVVDAARIHVVGYSGGCGNAVQLVAKYPGKFVTVVGLFGWGDYGLNTAADHSYWGSGDGGATATMTTRIGDRGVSLLPYRARCVLPCLPYAIQQSTAPLYLFWDDQDAIGRALRDVRDALERADVPSSRWYASESTSGSAVRWLHGYVDEVPALALLENLVYQRRDEPAPTVTSVGDYHVCGHLVHGSGFELWTADSGTANPRTHATGGKRHCVKVRFNALSKQFYVSPLSGACDVLVKMGATEVVAAVSAAETLFDLANA